MGDGVGPGDAGCGPELTWDLRIRRSAEDRASSCSMFLSIPGESQATTPQEPSPLPAPVIPASHRDRDTRDMAAGTEPLTFELVTDAVGHLLDLCCQLLQVIFGLCGIMGVSHNGNVPREGPREQGRVWGHSLCSGMGAERMML